jgi:hypothetical protein
MYNWHVLGIANDVTNVEGLLCASRSLRVKYHM